MRPTFSDIRNRLRIDAANDDLKRLGLFPVDDQRVRSLVGGRVQLARLDAGYMDSGLEQLTRKQSGNRIRGAGNDIRAGDGLSGATGFDKFRGNTVAPLIQ